MALIELDEVRKEFKVYKKSKGMLQTIRSLMKREYETKAAVQGISFGIDRGELVGYIGPNGAGKSTTIKLLSGILVPTSGTVRVNGRNPCEDRKRNAMEIGVVFGQRSQLYWDLPVEDTFLLYKKIYRIPDQRYKQNVAFFVELLQMDSFLGTPVRQLSLGQKMRANIAIAWLHDPPIVYLDEPTIGLDVVAKSSIRRFIREVNKEKQTTVILTTHDMDDIEQICNRLMLIDQGKLIYDGRLEAFKQQYSPGHMLTVEFAGEVASRALDPRLHMVKEEGPRKTLLFREQEISVAEAITSITRSHAVVDLRLQEPSIEENVKRLYEAQHAGKPTGKHTANV